MFGRTLIGLSAALLVATSAGASAYPPVPKALKELKPYQVVEQVMAQRVALQLSEQQVARLDQISRAVRTEKHRFAHLGGKPHTMRHRPMISRRKAFASAMAVLGPEQQERAQALFATPKAAPAPRKVTRPHGKP